MPRDAIPADETDEAKFVRLATKRVNACLKGLRLVGNLGTAQYGRNEAQVTKIEATLTDALIASMGKLRNVKASTPTFKL